MGGRGWNEARVKPRARTVQKELRKLSPTLVTQKQPALVFVRSHLGMSNDS